jgi:hypothetical protein
VFKSKKQKGPKTLIDPRAEKTPQFEFYEDWREMKPAWRVSLLEMRTPFGWRLLDEVNASQVREKLANYESMKWKELIGYRSHFIKVSELCREAQEHLTAIQQDDIDSVMSLGITQKARVVGIMEHNILKLLWWDPEHLVCPVALPNT